MISHVLVALVVVVLVVVDIGLVAKKIVFVQSISKSA